MARRRRREELEEVEDELNDSTGSNKRMRRASSDDEADKENMEVDSDELNCSQHPDFQVTAKVGHTRFVSETWRCEPSLVDTTAVRKARIE